MIKPSDLAISNLGPCRERSPLPMSTVIGDGVGDFVTDEERVLAQIRIRPGERIPELSFECAGAREQIFFAPEKTRAAIVSCGGLCPGINNVIRTLYFELNANYGVPEVLGIRFGYRGLTPRSVEPPVELTGDLVRHIHRFGGTILGTSRGGNDAVAAVDFLVDRGVDMLFCIGGDGTARGAHAIAEEAARRKLPLSVVAVPKTIDNDIQFCERSFGFFTAVAEAKTVIHRAHTEALSTPNGIGLVKLMGREAGFIAVAATIASGDVNFTLIPEVPFRLDGDDGLFASLERRLAARGHAVIVVAEGAGQELLSGRSDECDASGNRKLGDIGIFLKRQIAEFFAAREIPVDVKYFDPSYHIRSCPANTVDSLLCEQFARHAAHAAMAGKTDLLIGSLHGEFIHVPLAIAGGKKRVEPESDWWTTVRAMTAQEKWAKTEERT